MKDYLSEWADSENRTISNLVETLIGEAIAAEHKQTPHLWTSAKGNGTKRGQGRGGMTEPSSNAIQRLTEAIAPSARIAQHSDLPELDKT
jgi:hypothetical protein